MKMKARRFLAFLLTAVMTFTLLVPVQADDLAAGETAPAATVESVTLPVSEKVELNSDAAGDSQWQIRAGDDLWVDISGADEPTRQLSYSMVASLLTDGIAAVRCKTTNGDQVSYGSEYQVTVDFDAVPQFEPAPQPDPASLVISEAQAVPQATAETPAEDAGEPERVNESEAAILQAEEAMQAAEEALWAAEGVATSESAMTDEQLAALEEARANYEAAKAAYDEAVAASTSSLVAPMMAAAPAAPQNEGDPEVKPTYTITIKYVFEDGTKAADPWLGECAEGEPVDDVTVQSPEVLGYAAARTEISLRDEFPNGITEDKTITVLYRPALVNFTIRHYEQNVDNDEYTLVETETVEGYTEAPVGDALAKEKAGFYALLYDTTTPIAADGSTVVEIYYDRYYYLMTFDLGGGYGVEPVYARFGATIEVGTPTRPGYTFQGWQLNNEDANVPPTMPAENQNYVAKWQAVDKANVTLVFWGENADNEDYSYLGSAVTTAAPGTEFTYNPNGTGGPDIENTLICGKEEHTHTESCIDCTHTHTLDCYSAGRYGLIETNEPTGQDLTDRGNGIKTYTTSFIGRTTHYYLELDGKWYCAANLFGGKDDTQSISFDCSNTHTAECYICGKEEHHHTTDCYLNSILDQDLWVLSTETELNHPITVAADGSSVLNVYFDRTTFTLQFGTAEEGGWYGDSADPDYYGTITAKWGQKIADRFQTMSEEAGSALWSENESGDSPWTSYLDIMPAENRTYYNDGGSGQVQTAKYYGERLDGNGYDLMYSVSARYNGTLQVSVEDMFEFEGFTIDRANSTKVNKNFDGAVFKYTRNSYQINFYNYTSPLDTSYTLKYEQPFRDVEGLSDFVPPYPDNLEPNAYVFEGWYNAPSFNESSRVDFNTETMPANDVLLYASWVPVSHTVTFYLDSDMDVSVGEKQTVPHGKMLAKDSAPTEKTLQEANGDQYAKYDFVGWFYKDENGIEKAFDPDNMPVNRDLNLYAKWSSNVLMEYTIHYVYVDENGERFTIADDTTGSALAGTTKTFDAKAGSQLYTDYQEDYFPKTNSHSLTIDIDNTENNVYTFEYVKKPFVWYTVQYIDEETGKKLADDKQVSSPNAIVTETYKYIEGGWMPDAYQKRLVLAASDEENSEAAKAEELDNNVIIFNYHKDETHAPVHVMHMLQNIEGDGYTLYNEYTDLDQVINTEVSANILTDIEGAEFACATANGETVAVAEGAQKVTATLGEQGLELILYYDRIVYPYEFKFMDKETGEEIAGVVPITGMARYGAQVTQNAQTISGYALAEGEPNSKAIVIQKEDGQTAEKNVAIFYYVKSTASLTISKTIASNYDGAPFLFHITNDDGFHMDVLVPGNGSVTINDLQVGKTYTVTEDESWAWRYNVSGENTVKIAASGSAVTFTNTIDNDKWFDHTTSAENQWGDSRITRVGEDNQ